MLFRSKPIPYSKNPEEVREKWIEQIQELTGFKYEPQECLGAGDEKSA